MDQFKEIPLLESLLNFQKDAFKMLPLYLAKWQTVYKGASGVLQITDQTQ